MIKKMIKMLTPKAIPTVFDDEGPPLLPPWLPLFEVGELEGGVDDEELVLLGN